MDDIELESTCSNLLSLRKLEEFPRRLLTQLSGEWNPVREVCANAVDCAPTLFAAWLPDPQQRSGYIVIVFYDEESGWTMAAQYNRKRLEEESQNNGTADKGSAKAHASK